MWPRKAPVSLLGMLHSAKSMAKNNEGFRAKWIDTLRREGVSRFLSISHRDGVLWGAKSAWSDQGLLGYK